MSAVWEPERQTVSLRNATVAVKGTTTVDLTMDGATIRSVPVYAATMPAVGAKVLVLQQGGSYIVLTRGA